MFNITKIFETINMQLHFTSNDVLLNPATFRLPTVIPKTITNIGIAPLKYIVNLVNS